MKFWVSKNQIDKNRQRTLHQNSNCPLLAGRESVEIEGFPTKTYKRCSYCFG